MSIAPGDDQVSNLRDNLLPPPEGEDPKAPRMPFRSEYVLTRDQEDALVIHAIDRLKQIEDQLGRKVREDTGGKNTSGLRQTLSDPNTFLGKRERYTLRYFNHVDDRRVKDTVFEHSNLTASLSQRITMQMIASAIGFFFGQPDDIDWFSSSAVGSEDETLSDKLKKHSRWKVDQCGVKHHFIEALEFAFVRGEGVIKVTHQEESQIYKRTSTILMGGKDEATGQPSNEEPMLDAAGDYIVQGDAFVDEMAPPDPSLLQKIKGWFTGPEPGGTLATASPSDGGPEAGAEGEDATGTVAPQGQLQPTGRQVLKRDGVTVIPAVPVWEEKVITRKLVTFEGPEAQLVYYKDFLCPENALTVQKADLVAQLFDMNVMQVAQMFRGQYGEGDSGIADMKAAVTRLREMLGQSNVPKAAAGQPRVDFKETDTSGPVGIPVVEVAECYLTYDADGDGIQEEIMLVLDRQSKAPIYYEYLANVTVKGLRPFHVWRPMAMDGRWYGMGAMELFDPEQEFVDLQINRHNFRTSGAGIVTFWEPSATTEGSSNPNLTLNQGKTYTLRDGKKAADALVYIQLPTDAENLEYLISLFMQLMQLKSGKVNSGDQEMSGLPASKLATGINEIRETGEELFSRILAILFPGVKGALGSVIDVIYANLNRREVFTYFNGKADEILSMDPEEVRDLATNVTLELSRTQARKAMENGDRTTALIQWFYSQPFPLQQRTADYTRQQLKGFGVSQSDTIIEPVDLSSGAQPEDKPSAVAMAVAALIKSGAPIAVEDVSAVLEKAGLPPLKPGSTAITQPPPPDSNSMSEAGGEAAGPPQSAV